jgi:hypothetical protein
MAKRAIAKTERPRSERPKSAPALPEFTDEAYYRVQLRRPVHYAGRSFSPSDRQIMRGDIAKKIAKAIHTAEETPAP